jgi:hypothetical protein
MPTTTSTTAPTIEDLQRVVREIDQGGDVLERQLANASSGDFRYALFPMTGSEAELWLRTSAAAYQHALEMVSSGSIKKLVQSLDTTATPAAKAD